MNSGKRSATMLNLKRANLCAAVLTDHGVGEEALGPIGSRVDVEL